MKDVVEVEITVPQQELAGLLADPRNSPKWMLDLERYEPVSGKEGMPGSTYCLVPKEGEMVFLATVVERNLPDELRLNLKGSGVDVAVTSNLIALSPTKTKLISEEIFTFKSMDNPVVSSSVKDAIHAAHRRHMKDFRIFAERWYHEHGH